MNPEQVGRARRRELRRATITYLLDGPPKPPQCGQAKAAARARAAHPRPPKDNRVLKALARELQERTGQKYSVCLAEVRELAARGTSPDAAATPPAPTP
ncbi:hypothetical protein JHN59_08675 [Streptomyces sp. MBT49]|nr:hypothetical protein [Streptomyces sp. MBT49]